MKTVFTIFIIALAFVAKAQTDTKAPVDSSAALTFTGVVKVDSASKDELFLGARKWFSATFNDSKSVLNINDKEAGQLAGNGIMDYTGVGSFKGVASGDVKYQIAVYIKDGRYKVEMTQFIHSGTDEHTSQSTTYAVDFGLITNKALCSPDVRIPTLCSRKGEQKCYTDLREKITAYQARMMESLKQAMTKPSGTAAKDW